MRRLAAVALAAVLFGAVSCSDPTGEFCDRLAANFELSDLRDAIARNDRAAIERELAELRDVEEIAPADIRRDVTAVFDAVIDAVRTVIDVPSPEGSRMPVDISRLNAALANVAENAQAVVTYADRTCGITLRT